jgi:hypothetical protein
MCQPWLYFYNRFDALVENSLSLSIPYVRCHSVFSDDSNVYRDSVFADNLWINSDITFLTISCVSQDYIFPINLVRRSWIEWRCRLYTSVVTVFIDDFKFDKDFVFADDLCISNDIAFLTIPCVSHDFIFSIDFMRWPWISWRCRLNTSAVTQYSITISRSTVTLFSPAIYGSVMT